MATQKLDEKVQKHDEDAVWSKTGCKSPSRAHGTHWKHMSKHWSAKTMPAASCAQLPFGGAISLIGSPNICGTNLKLFTQISSSPKTVTTPLHDFGIQHKVRKPPLPNPSFSFDCILILCPMCEKKHSQKQTVCDFSFPQLRSLSDGFWIWWHSGRVRRLSKKLLAMKTGVRSPEPKSVITLSRCFTKFIFSLSIHSLLSSSEVSITWTARLGSARRAGKWSQASTPERPHLSSLCDTLDRTEAT